MRNQMTWSRLFTLAIGLGLWFLCFFTFVFRGWRKKKPYGENPSQ